MPNFNAAIARLASRLQLDDANATLVAPAAVASLVPVARRLATGRRVNMVVVGGSAAAGAGGIGVNHTFDARLAAKLNDALEDAERESLAKRPFGRIVRTNLAQGGTTSFWAALMADALHGRLPHILLWEYSINDHAVSLEAASREGSPRARARLSDETMRYLLDYWLRRTSVSAGPSPPPALLLAYLWDKQPAAAFKPGNRALCRRTPVPGSAFAAQRSVLDQFSSSGTGLAAVNMAAYVTRKRPGAFCPLVADSYYHPSVEGHELVADLLTLIVLRLLRDATALSESGTGMPHATALGRVAAKATSSPPPSRSLPQTAVASATPPAPGDDVSERLSVLFSRRGTTPAAALAWQPTARRSPSLAQQQQQQHSASPPFFVGLPPPTRLYAKSVRERADRKWMWLVPPCASGRHGKNATSGLSVWLPPDTDAAALAAISYFAMVSPGARLRHTLDGAPLLFTPAKGSFLAQSWGYLQQWHVFPTHSGGSRINADAREWRLCAEHVPNERCVGFRCGLEFKMPMKTAAVGWFLTLSTPTATPRPL